MKIISNFLLFYLLLSCVAVTSFFAWRCWPVKIHVQHIERIEKSFLPFHERMLCNAFQFNQQKFEAYFAKARRLFPLEVHDAGFGSCYYQTKIDGIVYKIWAGGMAEIRDGQNVKFYASDHDVTAS